MSQTLLLFSSNARPQYAQDILNVLSYPTGSHYTFRYRSEFISDAARDKWGALKGERDLSVLVLFSLQQEAHFQNAIFIPIRKARVVDTWSEADVYVVRFALTDLVSLRGPQLGERDVEAWRRRVSAFRDAFRAGNPQTENDCPYHASASLVTDCSLDALLQSSNCNQAESFMLTVEYLSRTAMFKQAYFVRFLELRKAAAGAPLEANSAGEFSLEGGKSYTLRLMQYQPRPVEAPVAYRVGSDDDSVTVVGRPGFDIASEYDIPMIPLHAGHVDSRRSTIVNVNPEIEEVQSSEIAIPVVLNVPHNVPNAVGGTLAVTASGAIGLVPTSNFSTAVKAIVAIAAVVFLFFLLYLGRVRISAG